MLPLTKVKRAQQLTSKSKNKWNQLHVANFATLGLHAKLTAFKKLHKTAGH